MKSLKYKILLIFIIIFIFSSTVFALSYKSQNYILKNARVIVSGGKSSSFSYSLNDVVIGSIFGGVASSANYSLNATNIDQTTPSNRPSRPTLNSVTSPTNIATQTLSGTKQTNTSIWLNGQEVVPLNTETIWSYNITLIEGNNSISITSKDTSGNESSPVTSLITLDTIPPNTPTLNPVTTPTNISSQTLTGTKEANSSILLNGIEVVSINAQTSWSCVMSLQQGQNPINITSKDAAGNESEVVTTSILLDTSSPTTPVVFDDGDYTFSTTQLHASWSSSDPDTGITEYQYAITTLPGVNNDVIDWTSIGLQTEVTHTGLSLTSGQTYYLMVKAINSAGLYSIGYSDGIIVDAQGPSGTILINNDAQSTTDINVTLNLSASDSLSGVDAMSFSNDGTNWTTQENFAQSKSWTLTEGYEDKTVYVKYKDKAGNWSAAYSDTIAYESPGWPSEEITIESGDGMAMIIIPPGALDTYQDISLITVPSYQVDELIPQDTSAFRVVVCQPYGLAFNKSVTLVLKLEEPEVPGTLIELGLYNDEDDKINFTGQRQPVAEDGYSVTFKINHFSMYAALSNLISQGAPIAANTLIPLPDMFTGAFTHNIALNIPPGRKQMQPNLQIQYRSSNPNSWLGMGWNLNPGYITRSTKMGAPSYIDTQDTFIFVSQSASTELVRLRDNLYQAKIESSFTRFYLQPDDTWHVVQKDGTVLEFGQGPDAKEVSDKGTFSWYITKVLDTNGNYVRFDYTKDQGKVYLYRVYYTGNENTGFTPKHRVEFYLESRDDVGSSYISTSRIATAKRLSRIEVKLQDELVWSYLFEYDYSQDTNRSLLKSITQYTSDNKPLPKQEFKYQNQTGGTQ